MPLGRAKHTVKGVVTSAGSLARITRFALDQMVKESRASIAKRAKSAYVVGGHHTRGGKKWAPLAASTVKRKAKKGYPRPRAPLVATGAMQRNQQAVVNLSVVGNAVQYTITTWNNKLYSGPHQTGYVNRLTGTWVPARPPSSITERDMRYVESIIRKYMPTPRRRR